MLVHMVSDALLVLGLLSLAATELNVFRLRRRGDVVDWGKTLPAYGCDAIVLFAAAVTRYLGF